VQNVRRRSKNRSNFTTGRDGPEPAECVVRARATGVRRERGRARTATTTPRVSNDDADRPWDPGRTRTVKRIRTGVEKRGAHRRGRPAGHGAARRRLTRRNLWIDSAVSVPGDHGDGGRVTEP